MLSKESLAGPGYEKEIEQSKTSPAFDTAKATAGKIMILLETFGTRTHLRLYWFDDGHGRVVAAGDGVFVITPRSVNLA